MIYRTKGQLYLLKRPILQAVEQLVCADIKLIPPCQNYDGAVPSFQVFSPNQMFWGREILAHIKFGSRLWRTSTSIAIRTISNTDITVSGSLMTRKDSKATMPTISPTQTTLITQNPGVKWQTGDDLVSLISSRTSARCSYNLLRRSKFYVTLGSSVFVYTCIMIASPSFMLLLKWP